LPGSYPSRYSTELPGDSQTVTLTRVTGVSLSLVLIYSWMVVARFSAEGFVLSKGGMSLSEVWS